MADLRLAFKSLLHARTHSLVILVCLTLGITVAVTAFALINALTFGPLPGITDRAAIARLSLQYSGAFGAETVAGQMRTADPLSRTDFDLLAARRTNALTDVAAEGRARVLARTGTNAAWAASAAWVTPQYFDVLGTSVMLGRPLGTTDAAPTAPPAVVVGYHLWEVRLGRRSDVLGQTLVIEGSPYSIVGVAPPRFTGLQPTDVGQSPLSGVQLWLPLAHSDMDPKTSFLHAFGRMAAGVTTSHVEAALAPVAAQIEASAPDRRRQATFVAATLGISPSERPLAVLGALALFMLLPLCVLLIAVTNVVNLQVARAIARARDVRIRMTLGATHAQATRWLHCEALILVSLATVASLLLTRVITRAGASLLPFDILLDVRVGVAAVAIAALTVWVSTWWPGRLIARKQPTKRRHILVVTQVAVAVALVLIAALSVRSIEAIGNQAPDAGHRVRFSQLTLPDNLDAATRTQLLNSIVDRLAALPDVETVGMSTSAPLDGTLRYWLPGDDDTIRRNASGGQATPGWIAGLGATVIAGRTYQPDEAGSAVVSDALARRITERPADAIGQTIRVQTDRNAPPVVVHIVGVIAESFTRPDGQPRLSVYVPVPDSTPADVIVLTRQRGESALHPLMQQTVQDIDARVLLSPMYSLTDAVTRHAGAGVLVGSVFAALGGLTTLLAFLGLLAMMAHQVTTRTRELAVRSAIGASPRDLLVMVLGQAVRLTAAGALVGVTLGVLLAVAMRSQLVGVSPADPIAAVATGATFVVVAVLAAAWPAMRAGRTNPAALLRSHL